MIKGSRLIRVYKTHFLKHLAKKSLQTTIMLLEALYRKTNG